MRSKILFTTVLVMLLALFPVSASAEGIVIVTVPKTLDLINRTYVNVPVEVVCDGLGDTPLYGEIYVHIWQPHGQKLNHGIGSFEANFSNNPGSAWICDGLTVNHFTIPVFPDPDSGVFHGGVATVNAYAYYNSGENCDEYGWCEYWYNESGESGLVTVRIR